MKKIIFSISILALFLITVWFKDGNILGVAEDGLIFYNISNYYHQAEYTWMEYPGLGSPSLSLIAAKPTYFVLSLLQSIGIPGFVIQAGVLWFLTVTAATGVYLLTKELFPKLPIKYIFLSVFFYLFNPITIVDVWNRFLLNYIFFFSSDYSTSSYLIGGLGLTLWIFLIFRQRQSYLSEALIISLFWTFSSFLIPWISSPTAMYTTTHRYLATSAIGIALFLVCIISLPKSKSRKRLLLLLASLLILIHTFSTHNYLERLTTIRSRGISDKIWSQVPEFPQAGKTQDPLVFYIDGENPEQVHNVLIFGFPSHLQLIYKIANHQSIVTLGNFEEVISAVTDGKVFTKQLLPEKPVPITNIYTFYLTNNHKLINTTDVSRDKLSKLQLNIN